MPAAAFYEPDGPERMLPTELTRGPWQADAQHAGPPAALLGGALERALTDVSPGMVTRVTCEILRPVGMVPLTVSAEVIRPGRRVAMAEGVLSDDDGPVLLARAWKIRTEDVELPAGAGPTGEPLPGPDAGHEEPFFATSHGLTGWQDSLEFRFLSGSWREPGPATVWARATAPIVAGQTITPLQRVLLAADGANGVSSSVPPKEWLFINTELTVHVHREPVGEWVAIDAASILEPLGVGLATSVLHDQTGPVARGMQSLIIGSH